MNCHEAQIQLSEYLDGELDPLRNKSFESHLLACPVCRAEADGLADCIQQVAQLPAVDPPPGFAQRVMAHARALEVEPSLWQKIIAPLRFSVPVQASAAVVIAVLAVLVYRNEPPLKNDSPAPSLPIAIAPSTNQAKTDKETPQPAAAPKAKLDRERLRLAEKPTAPSTPAISASRDTAPQATAKAEVASAVGELKDLPHRPPIQAQEIATGSENLRQESNPFGFGPSFSAPFRAAPFAPERVLSPLSEPSADVEFVVRRREAEPKKAAESRRVEAAPAADALAKRSSAPAAPQPNSLTEVTWFTVPAARYDEFKKELAAEATIDSERPIGSMTNDLSARGNRDLLIKVIVLTPLER
jgi:Putative zinc-finger